MKVTFIGAGSTVFTKNVLGDTMLCPSFHDAEFALYDIDPQRLEESFIIIEAMNKTINMGRATIKKYLGVEQRKDALCGAKFVVNAIQVGGYDPGTLIDFEVPTKYGLRQTIADTMGIGGIMRGMRMIHVLKEIAADMEDKLEGSRHKIAGINHMAWLLEAYDKDGNDLYPEIRRRAKEMNATTKHKDMVRFDYIDKLGYYCTESSTQP